MRAQNFKVILMKHAEDVIDLLEANGKRYGDDMLNLFKEDYCIIHTTAKCLRVRNMIKQRRTNNETGNWNNMEEEQNMETTIREESRDILGYALLLYAIQEGLIK